MRKTDRRPPSAAALLRRNSSQLARLVPRLAPEALHRLIKDHGLEECGALVAHATPAATHAYNVIAAVNGRRTNLDPVIVMTPRSGWWNCASERGGGLACWLEIARAVNEARPARTVRFIASSGHELGHFGLDAFLQNQPKLIKSAAAWMHLGANIGAAGGRPRLQASSNEIEKLAGAASGD